MVTAETLRLPRTSTLPWNGGHDSKSPMTDSNHLTMGQSQLKNFHYQEHLPNQESVVRTETLRLPKILTLSWVGGYDSKTSMIDSNYLTMGRWSQLKNLHYREHLPHNGSVARTEKLRLPILPTLPWVGGYNKKLRLAKIPTLPWVGAHD